MLIKPLMLMVYWFIGLLVYWLLIVYWRYWFEWLMLIEWTEWFNANWINIELYHFLINQNFNDISHFLSYLYHITVNEEPITCTRKCPIMYVFVLLWISAVEISSYKHTYVATRDTCMCDKAKTAVKS